MNNSSYNIVSVHLSSDRKKIYCIFSESISIDQDSAVTHGIAATDLNRIEKVRDVSTILFNAKRVTDELVSESIAPDQLAEFIQNNIQ